MLLSFSNLRFPPSFFDLLVAYNTVGSKMYCLQSQDPRNLSLVKFFLPKTKNLITIDPNIHSYCYKYSRWCGPRSKGFYLLTVQLKNLVISSSKKEFTALERFHNAVASKELLQS